MIKIDLKKNNAGLYQVILPVRVTPRSNANRILPYKVGDEYLQIKVTPSPEDGKANEAVIDLLSEHLSLPRRSIEIHSGHQSRYKRVAVELSSQTCNPAELLNPLAHPLQTEEEVWFKLVNP